MLYHVALAADWAVARVAGEYRISTIGVTLEQEGFIHTSWLHQVRATADRFYAGVDAPLVLLQIDETLLDSPWQVDPVPGSGQPGSDQSGSVDGFPHVYGPVQVGAVVAAGPVRRLPDGGWEGLPQGC